MDTKVIIYADKTILTIRGIKVCGLKPVDLEKKLSDRMQTVVRVIGVRGSAIEMDVYGLKPEAIQRDENEIIQSISAIEGVNASEFASIDYSGKAVEVNINSLPPKSIKGCAKERWFQYDKQCSNNSDWG